jgi:hypothetical protein
LVTGTVDSHKKPMTLSGATVTEAPAMRSSSLPAISLANGTTSPSGRKNSATPCARTKCPRM